MTPTMTVKSYTIAGWTYNAAVYCTDCAEEMGITNDKPAEEMGEDDGHPVFADSEWDTRPVCDRCLGEIPYVSVING